jgi:hypothetical protein
VLQAISLELGLRRLQLDVLAVLDWTMKTSKYFLPCILALFLAPLANAAGDYGNLAVAAMFGYGGNGWNTRPTVVNNFTPPYFSMHPPVYYGERYYRPYGDSPYASWPQLQPNPSYMPKLQASHAPSVAVTIENPYCPPVSPAFPVLPPGPEPLLDSNAIPPQPNQPLVNPPAKQPPEPAKSDKVPDVVQRSRGLVTIVNPFFRESTQYISRR